MFLNQRCPGWRRTASTSSAWLPSTRRGRASGACPQTPYAAARRAAPPRSLATSGTIHIRRSQSSWVCGPPILSESNSRNLASPSPTHFGLELPTLLKCMFTNGLHTRVGPGNTCFYLRQRSCNAGIVIVC